MTNRELLIRSKASLFQWGVVKFDREKKPKEWYMSLPPTSDLKSPFPIHIYLPVLACHCQKVFVYAELRHILVMKMDV